MSSLSAHKECFSEFNTRYIFITSNTPPCTWYSNEQCITMLPAFYLCIDEALGVENVENVSTNVHWHIQIIINKILFLTTK